MGKRIIISEQERTQIKNMYSINESFIDDTINFITDKGGDVVDFFSDILDDPESSVTKIKDALSDESISSKDKEKITNKINKTFKSEDESEISNYDESRIPPSLLFKKINSKLNNKKLSYALVANAFGESGFKCGAKGDGGEYAQSKSKAINVGGEKYCSFGLWQFNICGGLGISLLDYYDSSDSSDEKKISILKDCDKQIEFMTQHINKKIKGVSKDKTIREWVKWIVYEIERPKDKENAVFKRFNWAKNNLSKLGLDNELNDELS